ncbi:hypothetical protein RIF29_31562 [Crotalaria pallida]|uniref:SUI1 domain-containing protein n=1 Tax=Crotalaria pallida TaxID=3830 RepID=A0AAN9HX98_CROPI
MIKFSHIRILRQFSHTLPLTASSPSPSPAVLLLDLTSGIYFLDLKKCLVHIFTELYLVVDQKDFVTTHKLSRTSFMSEFDTNIPTAFDPFAEANAEDSGAGTKEYVHVRVQQRNGRKSLTTVQGLKKEYSYTKILKDLKKEFCCNGTVVQDPELGQVIQLQGDQRKNVSTFLVQAGIVKKENIKLHGF